MNRRRFTQAALGAAALAGVARGEGATAPSAPAERFAFALIGDIPYNALEERILARVLADFDPGVAFAIHVGDIKSGWEPCSDSLLASRHAALAASRVPLVYTPGDNEWLDCARGAAGGHAPLERLERLRALFHRERATDDAIGGLERQRGAESDFPENRRWRMGAALFVTVNVPGSNNGRDGGASLAAHNAARAAANERWLREAFALAALERVAAVVVAAHADPGFGRDRRGAWLSRFAGGNDAYRGFRQLLRELVTTHSQQVLFVHGDTHRFRSDRPLHDEQGQPLRNFQRVECFGSPFASYWVRITVDAALDPAFLVELRQV